MRQRQPCRCGAALYCISRRPRLGVLWCAVPEPAALLPAAWRMLQVSVVTRLEQLTSNGRLADIRRMADVEASWLEQRLAPGGSKARGGLTEVQLEDELSEDNEDDEVCCAALRRAVPGRALHPGMACMLGLLGILCLQVRWREARAPLRASAGGTLSRRSTRPCKASAQPCRQLLNADPCPPPGPPARSRHRSTSRPRSRGGRAASRTCRAS
jgi:hypothetical protein